MSQPVRVGLIGTGGIAKSHLTQLQALNEEGELQVEIVALCDVDSEAVAAVAVTCDVQHVYSDHRRMLEEQEMDALYVCVPPFAHTDIEIRAAEAGVHLFVEKPVVLELDQGLEILQSIRAAGIMSSVGYTLRYRHPWRTARDLLKDESIAMISADRWGGMPAAGHWWRDIDRSGGQLHEQTTHQVDSMRWIAGEVAQVYARYGRQVADTIPDLSVPDSQIIVLEFCSGAVGYVSTSCILGGGGGGMNQMQVLLDGVRVDVGRELVIQPEEALIMPEPYGGDNIDAAFIRAVASGERAHILCDYEEGLRTAAVSIAGNRSIESGRPESCKIE